ncbi:MAG TPA: porin, partial [Rhodobacteraceae bacterium]|nr:porin [Paracoccaceae bacterium]
MKNVLFATTALIATAGIASADVTVGGDAHMGV